MAILPNLQSGGEGGADSAKPTWSAGFFKYAHSMVVRVHNAPSVGLKYTPYILRSYLLANISIYTPFPARNVDSCPFLATQNHYADQWGQRLEDWPNTSRPAWLAGGEWLSRDDFVRDGRSMPPALMNCTACPA
jgi:hypothetical protein